MEKCVHGLADEIVGEFRDGVDDPAGAMDAEQFLHAAACGAGAFRLDAAVEGVVIGQTTSGSCVRNDDQSTSGKAHSERIVIHNEERIRHRLGHYGNLQLKWIRLQCLHECGIF